MNMGVDILVRIMRMLRLKHGISYTELSNASGISSQRLSQIELKPYQSTPYHRELVKSAMTDVVKMRKAALKSLEEDISLYGDRLLDFPQKEMIE